MYCYKSITESYKDRLLMNTGADIAIEGIAFINLMIVRPGL